MPRLLASPVNSHSALAAYNKNKQLCKKVKSPFLNRAVATTTTLNDRNLRNFLLICNVCIPIFFRTPPSGHLAILSLKLQTDSYEKWVEVRFVLGFTYLNKKTNKIINNKRVLKQGI